MSGAGMLVGERRIGGGAPCYVIAEVGVNHDGDLDRAHALVARAAEAGADAVKFQMFDPDSLVANDAGTAPYQARATGTVTQRALLSGLVLPDDAWAELADHSREVGVEFLCTPFDLRAAQHLVGLGIAALKVPSGELTNLPLLAGLAELRVPLLMSTGMATLDEVGAAVDAVGAAPSLALFHCVTAYPAAVEDSNLRAIRTMADAFHVPVGWSDHTMGPTSAVVAVTLGAALLEKHITYDRTALGPDHSASAEPAEFAAYLEAVRSAEAALGDGVKRPVPAEKANRRAARRSWHAVRDLPAGTILEGGDVVALRPAHGLAPGAKVEGRRTRRAVATGEVLTEAVLVADEDPVPPDEPRP